MPALQVCLFGKIAVCCDGQVVEGLGGSKVQELLCYFLLHRHRPYPRETLANLLWAEQPTAQSKKYLRQALWQLQDALNTAVHPFKESLLIVQPDCIQLNSAADLWLDVAIFERAFALVQGNLGLYLNDQQARVLQEAISLYKGDLLEGWYQDWCLVERERLQQMYLVMLEKLIGYCEAQDNYEAGIDYAEQSLRCDRSRERTYQRLMRLYYLAGDRAAALQQYKRCVVALDEELGVQPGKSTRVLYEQLQADHIAVAPLSTQEGKTTSTAIDRALPDLLALLRQLRTVLDELQHGLEQQYPTERVPEDHHEHVLAPKVLAAVSDSIAR